MLFSVLGCYSVAYQVLQRYIFYLLVGGTVEHIMLFLNTFMPIGIIFFSQIMAMYVCDSK